MYQIRLTLIWLSILLFPVLSNAQTPTANASQLTAASVKCNTADLSWISGNGNKRLVILETDTPSFQPIDGQQYYINNKYSGALIVSNTNADSIHLVDLMQNQKYWVQIIEYDESSLEYLVDSNIAITEFTTEYISFTDIYDDHYYCVGSEIDYYVSAQHSSSDQLNYTWDFKDGTTINAQDTRYTYSQHGIYKIDIEANSEGCSYTLNVRDTVAPFPQMNLELKDVEGNDSIQCLNYNLFSIKSNVYIPFLSTAYDFAYYYYYLDDTNNLLSVSYYLDSLHLESLGEHEIILKVTNWKNAIFSDGCTTYDTIKISVLEQEIESNKIEISHEFSCLGDSLELSYSGSTDCYWILGADTLFSSDTSLLLSSIGEYPLKLVDNSILTQCNFEEYTITVNSCLAPELPDNISLSKENLDKDTLILPPAMRYLWSTGSEEQSIIIDAASYSLGSFYIWGQIEYNSDNVFRDTVQVTIKEFANIENLENTDVLVYPNPSKDIITVSINELSSYIIYNLQSESLESKNVEGNSVAIDISSLQSGCYYLSIQTAKGEYWKKIIKY